MNNQFDDPLKAAFIKSYQKLVNTAFKLLGNRESAEDIVQDVFVILLQKRKTLTQVNNHEFYLKKMVVNRSLNFLKRSSKIRYIHDYSDFSPAVSQTRNDVLFNELEDRLGKAINLLPPRCKTIFCLSRMDGMNNQQIADTLNISKRTVEAQLFTALSKLRNELSTYLYLISAAVFLLFLFFIINLL